VKLELAQIASAWPLGASLAAALALQGVQAGRRRGALNEALHELRRPLQTLALATPAERPGQPSPIPGAVKMAATALERLEREVNGEAVTPVRVPTPVAPLLYSALARWQARALAAGASLSLPAAAGAATIDADPLEIARALDNLIANAIEHGGSEILLEASEGDRGLTLAVVDSGRGAGLGRRRRTLAAALARISGRGRRSHGLPIVRRIAIAHGGGFRLLATRRGTEAVIALPLSSLEGRQG
jgi:signal transduction histidine kinase